jgi:hypothetical protein
LDTLVDIGVNSTATTETNSEVDSPVVLGQCTPNTEDKTSTGTPEEKEPEIELIQQLKFFKFRTPTRSSLTRKRAHIVRLQEGNVGIILAEYQDVFSDFDPRPHTHADLSKDFLRECQSRILKLQQDDYDLRLLIPTRQQDVKQEETIIKRVTQYFADRYVLMVQKHASQVKYALFWLFCGLLLMFISAISSEAVSEKTGVEYALISVMLDPAGWFLCWSGLDKCYESYKHSRTRVAKARKFAELNVTFLPYGPVEENE